MSFGKQPKAVAPPPPPPPPPAPVAPTPVEPPAAPEQVSSTDAVGARQLDVQRRGRRRRTSGANVIGGKVSRVGD